MTIIDNPITYAKKMFLMNPSQSFGFMVEKGSTRATEKSGP